MSTLLLYILLVIANADFSAEIVLKGNYKGKDIFIRNPFNPQTNGFCVHQIFVNDRLVLEKPELSAIRVELSHLNPGDLVVIKILHNDGCKPVIVNPQVLQGEAGFKFLSTTTDNNSIHWITDGETGEGKFMVEQEIKVKKELVWEVLKEVQAKGGIRRNQYAVAPNHFPGENNYRIRYEPVEADPVYSVEIKYTSTKDPVTFYPNPVATHLNLSYAVEYVITDRYERVVKKGTGDIINVQELRPGEYFLLVQNRTEKFVKK